VKDLSPGEHTISLEVTDPNGGTTSHSIEVTVESSLTSSLMLPLALLAIIGAIVLAVVIMRGRGRKGVEEETGSQPSEEPQEEVVEYHLDTATAYTPDVAPEVPSEEGAGEALDEDAKYHQADETPIYDLEKADEFRPGEGDEKEPHD
jgi:hypothetical protein